MSLRKLRGSKIFTGRQFIPDRVLIVNEEGEIVDIAESALAGEDIEDYPGILCPGFINCHCHLELSHMKHLVPEETGLADFVYRIVTGRQAEEREILDAIEKAEDEMLQEGIVAVGDICNNSITITQKNRGRIYYHNFIEASGYDPANATARFERALALFREYGQYYSIPVESNSIVPHAPYSVSDPLWQRILDFPGNHLLSIHNQETEGENEWFLRKEGAFADLYERMKIDTTWFEPPGSSSLQNYLPKFYRHQSLILVHNVHSSREDIRFAKNAAVGANLYWCLCPNANWYISRQKPPVPLLMEEGCNIVLGTDSLASNYQLSIMEEIKRLITQFPSLGLETCLQWATLNGARALQMEGLLGSFEKGKRPGILLIGEELSVKRLL